MFVIFYYFYKKYKTLDNEENTVVEKITKILGGVSLIINLFISVYAAYLSLSCNWGGRKKYISKLFFAMFAFLLGFTYLIYYFIFNYLTQRCK